MSPRIGLDLPAVLRAATELADTHGIEQLTLAGLAKKLNIRTPSLYNHVDGLPGLRSKLAVHGLELLYDQLVRAAVGRSGDEAVHAFAESYLAFARAHPGLYGLTLASPAPGAEDVAAAGKKLVDLLVRLMDSFSLSEADAIHAIRGLRSVMHGFASLEASGGFGMPFDTDVSFRRMVDTFLAGLHAMRTASLADGAPGRP